MYIDYLKNDYSDKTEQEKEQYIKRDKRHLGGLIQERITNDIDNIVDRWYELDDVGYIPENEKFLYLLKEAEQLYCFAYYTGTISIVGIAAEEYCRCLIKKYNITDVDKQFERINKLADSNIFDEQMKSAFHRIRKIRNDCMHYNVSFKNLSDDQLKNYALEMIQLYKKCLSISSVNVSVNYDKLAEEMFASKEMTFREFVYRNRNIQKQVNNIDLQIDPKVNNLIFTSQYYVAEIDIETDVFKEMTLFDMERGTLPVVVDLTLPQADMIKALRLEQGNVIIATIISTVTSIGQTEEWHLLNIKDVYREVIDMSELEQLL
ncbi:hypothetical protein AB8I98_001321 [Clostridium perfringens]